MIRCSFSLGLAPASGISFENLRVAAGFKFLGFDQMLGFWLLWTFRMQNWSLLESRRSSVSYWDFTSWMDVALGHQLGQHLVTPSPSGSYQRLCCWGSSKTVGESSSSSRLISPPIRQPFSTVSNSGKYPWYSSKFVITALTASSSSSEHQLQKKQKPSQLYDGQPYYF